MRQPHRPPTLRPCLLLAWLAAASSVAVAEPFFRRGDANADGEVNIADAVRTLFALFVDGEAFGLLCADAGDTNDDGALNLSDAVSTLHFLFTGGQIPPPPGPWACGLDPTADLLGCGIHAAPDCRDETPPARPVGLTAVPANGQVVLDWADNTEADLAGYNLYRSTTAGTGHVKLNGALLGASSYVDTAVTNGTRYNYQVTAVDAAGAESVPSSEVSSKPTAGPPDPSDVAPEAPIGVIPSFADSVKFLYEGSGIQTGVTPGAIVEEQVAVLHGRVRTPSGEPVSMATVAVLGHPELGETLTREDGEYDLAVNGGGTLTVELTKDGFLPVQRQARPLWNGWEGIEEVVMTPLDPVVTTVALAGATEMQVARGRPVTDADGTRQATVLFPAGVTAEMVLPNGTKQGLNALHVRATEYTVGATGPQAMPAPLPPASGYTYCVELSVDEAIAAGATEVRFSEPLALHVDNFIGFPVGEVVPLGWYDRARGVWVAQPNGRVIAVLGITGGLADIDTDGDGLADDEATLAALAITQAERQQLAGLYPGGGSLWRSRIPHFSPWDCNWGYGPPLGAGAPRPPPATPGGDLRPCKKSGSIIGCDAQTLDEVVEIAGSPFRLVYQSRLAPGRAVERTIRFPIAGAADELPELLPSSIVVRGEVAGQTFKESFVPQPELYFEYTWDGRNRWGQWVEGPQPIEGEIAYVYKGIEYQSGAETATAFGQAGVGTFNMDSDPRGGLVIELTAKFQFLLRNPPRGELGPWTIDVHHRRDPGRGIVFLGSGGTVGDQPVVEKQAGGGSDVPAEGKAAAQVDFISRRIAVGPDGSTYQLDHRTPSIVWRVGTDGIYRAAWGCPGGASCTAEVVDGANARKLNPLRQRVVDFDVGPDGRLHVVTIVQQSQWTVWRVEKDGTILRLAGAMSGAVPAATPDGLVARDVVLKSSAVRVAPDGSVYVLEITNGTAEQIYRLDANGTLVHILGTRSTTCAFGELPQHGADPRDVCFRDGISDFDVDAEGNVYILTPDSLSRVTTAGAFAHLAGAPVEHPDCTVQGAIFEAGDPVLPVTCMRYWYPTQLRVAPDGVPCVLFGRIGPPPELLGGTMENMALVRLGATLDLILGGGAGKVGGVSDRGFWLRPPSSVPVSSFDFTPRGRIVVGSMDGTRNALMASLGAPRFEDESGVVVPAPDGRAAWIFDPAGRHLRTRDLLTGATFWTFGYDAEGRLSSVTDGAGQVTELSRTADGSMVAIAAPGGQTTLIDLNADGFPMRIENPAGEAVTVSYLGASGLLESYTDERGDSAQLTWDEQGRLLSEMTALGGTLTLARTDLPGGREVVFSRGGRTTAYRSEVEDDGTFVRTITAHDGGQTVYRHQPDGVAMLDSPDGTTTTSRWSPDPRFGSLLPYTSSLEVKKGASTLSAAIQRSVVAGQGYFGSGILRQSWTLNGKTTTADYDASTSVVRVTSAAGRLRELTFDALGRVTSIDYGPGAAIASVSYGASGHIANATFGAFERTFGYDSQQRLVSLVDGAGREYQATYDADDRLASLIDSAGQATELTWHPNGSLASFAMPSGQDHLFDTTPHGEFELYRPPASAQGFTRTYGLDGRIETQELPGGRAVQYLFDAAGFAVGQVYPEATVSFTPAGVADLPATLTREPQSGNDQALAYTWQGTLPVKIVLGGAVEGVVDIVHSNDFVPTTTTLTSGGESIVRAFTWDADNRILGHGPVSYTRSGPDRLVSQVAVGNASIALGWTLEGVPASRTVTVGGTQRYHVAMTYQAAEIVSARSESIGAATHGFVYHYGLDGRLASVLRDGVQVEAYAYDLRGNRTSAAYNGGAPAAAAYDAQDRILSQGATSYTVNADGFLAARGADSFVYSTLGELLSATVGGVTVSYDYDAFHRLVRRNGPDGATVFFYGDPLDMFRPSAYRAPGEGLTALHYDELGFLVAFGRGASLWIVAADQVGSPRLVIDNATGAVVKEVVYDTYGRVLSDSAPTVRLPLGFASGIQDPVTGLVRFGYRDYDPVAGRWTARDPSLLEGGQFNFYEYVASDPVQFRDPLGLLCVGGSFYSFVGGGGKVCYKDNGWSVCAEAGIGFGDAIDVVPLGNVDDDYLGVEAGLKANIGNIISLGCEGSIGIDPNNVGDPDPCNNDPKLDGDCKAGAFGFDASPFKGINTATADPKGIWSSFKSPKQMFGPQGKLTSKACKRF